MLHCLLKECEEDTRTVGLDEMADFAMALFIVRVVAAR